MLNQHSSQNEIRRSYIVLLLIAVVSLLLSGCNAAAESKVYRVGILDGLDFFSTTVDGFKSKMTGLGYVEGKNIEYDVQQSNVDPVVYEQILKKFVADQVDLIFVFPTEAAEIAKAVTQGTNIPIVFAYGTLEGNDLVESIRQPGGNITGVRFPGVDLSVKRLELLYEIAPQAKRVWVAYLKNYPSVPDTLEALRPAAAASGITLIEIPAANLADIQADLEARAAADDPGLDAILTITEPLVVSADGFAMIRKFAADNNIPIAGALLSEKERNVVFDNTTNNIKAGELAASLADKVLKGIPAGTIPVLTPEQELVINYKVAQELGLTISEGLLRQANRIIR